MEMTVRATGSRSRVKLSEACDTYFLRRAFGLCKVREFAIWTSHHYKSIIKFVIRPADFGSCSGSFGLIFPVQVRNFWFPTS